MRREGDNRIIIQPDINITLFRVKGNEKEENMTLLELQAVLNKKISAKGAM